jgi:outer membrane protein TolC
MAASGREIADVALTSVRAELRLVVVETYYDALLSDRLRTIAEATYQQAEATYEQTRLAKEAGRQPEFDLLRSQVARDTQRPGVIRRRSDRRLAHLRLKQLLELPLETELQLTTDLDAEALMPPGPFAQALEASRARRVAVEARTVVRQAETAVRIRESAIDVVKAQRLPSVNIVSAYGLVSYPNNGFPTDFRTNWTLGAVPVLTGGRIKAEESVARADLAESQARLKQTTEFATLDTQNAYEDLDAAEAAWEAVAGIVQQAVRAYEIAEIRYREGLSTQLELSDARLLLVQAQANRAQAGRDLQVARVHVALLPDLPIRSAAGAVVTAAAQTAVSTAAAASQTRR